MEGYTLCNDATLQDGERIGDPTELALLDLSARFGIERENLEHRLPRIGEIAFDSARKRMTTLHEENGRKISYTKGSPDEILERSTYVYLGGEKKPFTKAVRKDVEQALTDFTSRGLRVLALGMKEGVANLEENGLTFLGMVGIADPIRKEAKEAVAEFARAGV